MKIDVNQDTYDFIEKILNNMKKDNIEVTEKSFKKYALALIN